ncbi:MAG: putative glycosyltransferase [Chloroflexi bacterium]|jgi:N-acetylglucosaminyl-diphospho-decaprenol L-rhamnosyltransferase|nr:putative glycosyltransferase [Chloroflexota bacterium]
MHEASVVILNYNGGPLLREVVEAVLSCQTLQLGVVVVDNGSSDGSLQPIDDLARNCADGRVLVLRTGANLGYAKGNNIGIGAQQARYYVLLNPDAVVEEGTLRALVTFMDNVTGAAICAPRLSWPDGTPQPYSYGSDPSPLYMLRRALARRAGATLHSWNGAAPMEVDWVAGTCMVIRAEALSVIGLLDERIFMYFEDNDLCLRARKAGWQVYFVPTFAVRHHNKPSYADRVRQTNYMKGLALFYDRHYGRIPGGAIRLLARLRSIRA